MKKFIIAISAVGLAMGMPVVPAAAQDDGPQRMEDVTWARVVLTKFKQGQRQRAMQIIEDYFAKADDMTGKNSGVHGIHFDTGEWDAMYVFPMEGGPNDMTWVTSPDDIAWMTQMVKLAGSEEKAMAIMAEFDSLIQAQTSYIGHAHTNY
jgi:hypothetical protein